MTVRVDWYGTRFLSLFTSAIGRGVERSASNIAAEALDLILTGSKSGIIYGSHQASAPGEAPASHYGVLVANFRVEVQTIGFRVVASVINNAPYAGMLEVGTRYMRPRPFMAPAAARVARRVGADIATTVRQSVF